MTPSLLILGEVVRPLDLDLPMLARLAAKLPSQPMRLAAGRDAPGIKLDALLSCAGVKKTARSIVAESEDGRTLLNLPIQIAKSCLVLHRVGELPLPRGLGGPLRLYAPRYGEVKALASLYVSDAAWVRDTDTERHVLHF